MAKYYPPHQGNGKVNTDHVFGILHLGHWNLPFDLAQGGEFVEPFDIWILVLEIFLIFIWIFQHIYLAFPE